MAFVTLPDNLENTSTPKYKTKQKSRSKSNRVYGTGLKALRYSFGIFKQDDLAKALGWDKHQVRDRECGYASIRLVDIMAFSKAFGVKPVEVLKKITEKKDEFANVKDFEDALSFYKMKVSDAKDDFRYHMEDGKVKPRKLISQPFSEEDIAQILKRQGRLLMAARIKQGMSSQWVFAMNLGYNPSFIQHRESGETPIKLEELIEISQVWDVSYIDLGEWLLSDKVITPADLQHLRSKFC